MSAHRHHSDILIAGLLLVGMLMWLAVIGHDVDVAPPIEWLIAGFFSAHIARHVLADLDRGETVIAAFVTIAIVIGIDARRSGEPIDAGALISLGAATGGALAGAAAATARVRRQLKLPWLFIAGGFAGFGGAALAAGITMLVTFDQPALAGAFILGQLIGSTLLARFTAAGPGHTAIGQAIVLGVFFTQIRYNGFGLGIALAGVGAAGGALGAGLRGRAERRPARPPLPEARVRSDNGPQ